MTKKSGNSNLNNAMKAKNDEFYTQLSDIENELKNYKHHFKDIIVFCNCDDPEYSNFFKYFARNFKHLGLKKLISTHYESGGNTYKIEVNAKNIDKIDPYITNLQIFETGEVFKYFGEKLIGDGDFRSEESIEILANSDIVVTNPPFSLLREYIAQLMEYEKDFLIVGTDNAITYKEIFPLIKENKIWRGYTRVKEFIKPDGTTKKFGNIGWYTNLEHNKRNEKLILYKTYHGNEEHYPKYDNYDAINIDKVAEIPLDYTGVMGVPITFIDKYNPNQFEIIGSDYEVKMGLLSFLINKNWNGKIDRGYINGKRLYSRILIKAK